MGEVFPNQFGLFDASDHLYGAAAVLTARLLNAFAKNKIETPAPMVVTRAPIFAFRSLRLQ
jgi:hypothetical protein